MSKTFTATKNLAKLTLCLVFVCYFVLVGVFTTTQTAYANDWYMVPDLISVAKGDSTLDFVNGNITHDLWKSQEATAGSEDEIKLNYTFSVNTASLKTAFNGDTEPIPSEHSPNTQLSFAIYINVYYEAYDSAKGVWYDLGNYYDGAVAKYGSGSWGSEDAQYLEFATFNAGTDGPEFTINKSLSEIKKVLLEDARDSETFSFTDVRITKFFVEVDAGCRWADHLPDMQPIGRTYDFEKMTIIDKHVRTLKRGFSRRATLDSPLGIVGIKPQVEGLADSDFYDTTGISYTWHYRFFNAGEYGIPDSSNTWEGSYTTTNPTTTVRELLNGAPQKHKALVMSLIGISDLHPMSQGFELCCDATYTYADEKSFYLQDSTHVEGHVMLSSSCPHTCTVCHGCTLAENAPCNSYVSGYDWDNHIDIIYRWSKCTCPAGESKVPFDISDVPSATYDEESIGTDYTISVEQIKPTESTTSEDLKGTYFEFISEKVANTDIKMVFEVSLTRDGGESYQGYGMAAVVNFQIPQDIATGLINGTLALAHIDSYTGESEVFTKVDTTPTEHGTYQVVQSGETYTVYVASESFSPIVIMAPPEDIVIINVTATMSEPINGDDGSSLVFTVPADANYTVEFDYAYLEVSPYPDVDAEHPFEEGKTYAFRVVFSADGGYVFDEDTIFTVNGIDTYAYGIDGRREFVYTIKHSHTNNSEWSKDETNHWKECTCGNQTDKFEHTYIDDSDMTCEICGHTRTIIIPQHTHTYGEWARDEESHWKECSCGNKTDKLEHVYTDDSDTDCNECGYERTVTPVDPVNPVDPVDPNPTDPTEPTEHSKKKGLSGGAIAGIAVGGVVFVGIVGFAIFWFAIKKKSFADLVAVFKGACKKK